MSRLLRNPRRLILLCVPIVLAGCQAPLAPSMSRQQPASINQTLVDATPVVFFDDAMLLSATDKDEEASAQETGKPESPKPANAASVAGPQQQSDCLTGQLADSLMLVFKTFTGR
jgi:hypothetical protein